MVIPGNLLIPQNLRHGLEASQMNALSICHHDLVLRYALVADVIGLVGDILMRA